MIESPVAAVKGLSDLDKLVPILQALGTKHVGYGVLPRVPASVRGIARCPTPPVCSPHYDVVGQALIATLGDALGDKFTDDVKAAWVAVYGIIQKTMIGDNYASS